MQSNIFVITAMAAPWEGLHYSVSWPSHGVVRTQRYLMVEQAVKTGADRFGASNGKECVRINSDVIDSTSWTPDMLDHLFGQVGELRSMAFPQRKHAENFVERMEKIITWKLLAKHEQAHN